MRLNIRHETTYVYERPVAFGPHRLLVRPRDSHALRVVGARLTFSPLGSTRWIYDATGNCLCLLQPEGESTRLSIVSELEIERYPAPLSPLHIADPQTLTPIVYSPDDHLVLGPYLHPVTPDPDGVLARWLRGRLLGHDEPALDFLLRLTREIHQAFDYSVREAEGVQAPLTTLALGSGACRDLAWLMIEAARRLGYAARFVSGYIHAPGAEVRGEGATHAWCEVFLPAFGWMEFDPTNGIAESPDLIPIAVARTPAEASPINGHIIGDPGRADLAVKVAVKPDLGLPAAA